MYIVILLSVVFFINETYTTLCLVCSILAQQNPSVRPHGRRDKDRRKKGSRTLESYGPVPPI